MRCEEKSGFLMLHRCDRLAQFPCAYCGKQLCAEHAYASNPNQPPAAADTSAMPPTLSQRMPTNEEVVVCQACYHTRRQPQTAQQQHPNYRDNRYYDDYYPYPYYGGYHPYYYGSDYDDRDRRAFDRDQTAQSTADTDALGS